MTKQQVVSKGFTLIELMIVVTIIGILASISLSNFSKYKNNAKVAESYQLLSAILKSQGEYFVTNLRYRSLEPNPTTITTGSSSLIEQDASWTAMGTPLPLVKKLLWLYCLCRVS
ncbi:MAG: prepilin-type N-terminal cleavage/methylation domain-containing protein [Bdellovibrionota bacterium]